MTVSRRVFLGAAAAAPALAAQTGATASGSGFKLRYGPRVGLVQGAVPEQLDVFHRAGFRAFEYNGLPGNTPEQIRQIRAKMDQLGMSMGTFVVNRGGWRPTSLPDRAAHPRFLEDVKRAVELHKIVRNEVATVTSGLRVPHLTFEQQTRNAIEALRRAAEMVEKTNLVLVLEPLNEKVDHAGYFVVYSGHAAEIIGGVNHPNVRILFDIYHQQISEGNIINHLGHYWDLIGYIQTGDVPGRREPYTGEINYQNVFRFIHSRGYKGILGLEHGLSMPGEAGWKKLVEAYRRADAFDS
ncbi:MAG TPA: TIM barrel protein [Bryobacteraceae bacterium]|nr:TIM barrel protein [Bryobacteraceae bacterium]